MVSEARDEHFKRTVKTAKFSRVDGGDPVPELRDVEFLHWSGSVAVLTGIEGVADDKLARPRLYAQTWQMVPEPYEQLSQAEAAIGRLVERLRQAGITVRMLPGGGMHIPGEMLPGGDASNF